jgi:hypothetical protein
MSNTRSPIRERNADRITNTCGVFPPRQGAIGLVDLAPIAANDAAEGRARIWRPGIASVLALLFGINEKNHGFISFHGYGCFLLAWPPRPLKRAVMGAREECAGHLPESWQDRFNRSCTNRRRRFRKGIRKMSSKDSSVRYRICTYPAAWD